MAGVATYIFLPGTCAEAFEFYKAAFGTDYAGNGIMRFGDAPTDEEMPPEMADLVMNVGLPLIGDHLLMGTDNPEVSMGNNVTIMLMPDSKADADDLYAKLSDGGSDHQPMADMFWGDYWGSFVDRFGIGWQIDVEGAAAS